MSSMNYQVSISEGVRTTKPDSETFKKTKDSSLTFPLIIFVSVNLLLVVVTIIVLLGVPKISSNGSLCLSEQCVNTASRILLSMDRSVDPCTDFYQYACGGWIKLNPIPDWTATWDRLSFLREALMHEMRQLLESRENGQNKTFLEPSSVSKARALYRTCMDTDKLEAAGLGPLEKTLKAVGLPAIPPTVTNSDGFDWLFTIARARRLLGTNIIYGLNVAEDIEQVQPGFSVRYLLQPQKFFSETAYYKKYIDFMIKAYTNETIKDFSRDIIKFSSQIAKIMTPPEVRRSPGHLFHEVTLTELANGPGLDNDTWRTVNWTRYINIVFNDTNVAINHVNDTAILFDLPYLQKAAWLLRTTNQVTLERYLWWSVFSTVAPLTLGTFRLLGFEFSQQLLGLKTKTPRWKHCTNNVNSSFGLALSYLYIRTHFDKFYQAKALGMLEDIRYAFEEAVHNLDWMDAVTRKRTLTKLHAIRAFVGYPAWIMNATLLDIHYRQANVIEGNHFQTHLDLTNAVIKRNLQKIRRNPDRNRAVDYGSIGAIMGHEITHGFDDQGRRYDENGNLNQWWSLATLDRYHIKVKCIIEQYSNYTMPEFGDTFSVHGYNTQGENIADNGGLRAAFEGYKSYQSRTSSESLRLPGLPDVNTDQLFFLGFAQIWCGNATLGALKSKLVEGVHSPNRIRVLGSLKNSNDFARSWNCLVGTPMNPLNKCQLW